jgi:hypothetical protein
MDFSGRPTTTLCDMRDDFNFAIVNFSFLRNNIPLSPAYGVDISQLIRYVRACYVYESETNYSKKLMSQGYNIWYT